jgi:hypothetical protein
LVHGPLCKDGSCAGHGSGVSLFDRVRAACGLGGGRKEYHGDGSHRVSDDGNVRNLVRDCSGATEVAGTQVVPGFRFAAAEQLRLYGGSANLPTTQPHWPVPAGEPVPPADAPKTDKPAEKPTPEKAPDPKKSGGTTGLSVNRPFTRP